jgi:hypothetical protein
VLKIILTLDRMQSRHCFVDLFRQTGGSRANIIGIHVVLITQNLQYADGSAAHLSILIPSYRFLNTHTLHPSQFSKFQRLAHEYIDPTGPPSPNITSFTLSFWRPHIAISLGIFGSVSAPNSAIISPVSKHVLVVPGF